MKTLEQHFIDWESEAFGFGYGTGEPYVIPALKTFFNAFGRGDFPNGYDHLKLETAVGPVVAWLLINTLCRENIIEYGTSPRGGWLTKQGEALKAFVDSKSAQEIVDLITEFDNDYIKCLSDHCNCGDCAESPNPFWR